MARGNEKLKQLIGRIKDKASQSKAVLSKPTTVSLHLSLLRATTHDPHAPPSDKHLNALLSFGNGSRASSSHVIKALMDRLHLTADSSVALKCLIAVHRIIRHGNFILRDQLSVCPAGGGRNYLNLAHFRDASTPISWEVSCWVRWFAQYVEHLVCTSRTLGFFIGSSSDLEKGRNHDALSSLADDELITDLDCLVGLVEEMCKRPDALSIDNGNNTVVEIVGMVGEDYLSAANEISVRVSEFGERLDQLGFTESVELICALKRLENCRDLTATMATRKEAFWGLVMETKEMVWSRRMGSEEGEKDWGRLLKKDRRVGGSTRFQDRVLWSGDEDRFTSARFGAGESGRFLVQSLDTVHSYAR